MRYLVAITIMALTACSGEASTATTVSIASTPTAVVKAWVAAVEAGDIARLDELVEPVGLTLVAGIENALEPAELAALLNAGLPADLAAQYWASFRDEFRNFAGVALGDLRTAGEAELHGAVVAVELVGDDGSTTVMVRTDGDQPQIDMAATLAGPLSRRFGSYLTSILGTEEGPTIGAAYRTAVVPALEAVAAQAGDDAELEFQLEYIKQVLTDIPSE